MELVSVTSYTSDERREVAAWLRMEVSEEGCLDYVVHRIINDVLGVNGAWGAKAAHILADLIDPTCHKVIPSEMEGCVFCSNCGAEIGEYGVPNYCHNCGHRVVSGDGE